MLSNRYKIEDMPDMSGKVAVVTGGSRGIGEAAVSALVQKGCEGVSISSMRCMDKGWLVVHIISATTEHQEEAKDNIAKLAPDAHKLIHTHAVDLGSLTKLIPTAQNLASSLSRLDILHLNAGVGVAPFGLTNDGLGNHYAINYLSHLVIADILTPKMIETSKKSTDKYGVRIVLESSELHRGAPSDVKCESVEEMNEDIGAANLYNRSKLFEWVPSPLQIIILQNLTK
jgi:NAD(P)-dependent dehydrogenase (short-subunit alcohol dehydrogenase family)